MDQVEGLPDRLEVTDRSPCPAETHGHEFCGTPDSIRTIPARLSLFSPRRAGGYGVEFTGSIEALFESVPARLSLFSPRRAGGYGVELTGSIEAFLNRFRPGSLSSLRAV